MTADLKSRAEALLERIKNDVPVLFLSGRGKAEDAKEAHDLIRDLLAEVERLRIDHEAEMMAAAQARSDLDAAQAYLGQERIWRERAQADTRRLEAALPKKEPA